ncbi:MAG: isoleucine--tRNA ligase [Thermomicrobiales bacterium]|nr:isoleucine--tRNA ligase [Thermomicrobiales bacterium]
MSETTAKRATFASLPTKVDFPALEREQLRWWQEDGVVQDYLHKNDNSGTTFSFIDGPITANNPMGVHHAWGRSYKDLFQKYHNMLGDEQRFQNGFDCQGLWVEVEVEKELGLKNKREIEEYGIANFVERCKQRVLTYSARQTEQSKRLGYFMDWDHSYFTMSDENNYTIWHYLKTCYERGWIYKGHDVMPWCPRCGTGLSEHEIVTEGYQERTHLAVFVAFPLVDEDANLMVWTTTPWTLTVNTMASVNPELDYALIQQDGKRYWVAVDAIRNAIRGEHEILETIKGAELVGKRYRGPFDDLPAVQGLDRHVISWSDVSPEEGTGIVHNAPGAGKEDFALGNENDLPAIAPIDEFGNFLEGFGWLTGMSASGAAKDIEKYLKEKGILYRSEQYTHRYPVCWRCGTDLLFRLVDEWFISMDGLREQLKEQARTANWYPAFGLEREIDWLENMHDWMISKKRYWGLALPIFDCEECGTFEVIGSETELKERAVAGWESFEGHTPHRPYLDDIEIECKECGSRVHRVKDVGNPWLDAGIVAMSTLHYRNDKEYWEKWYPADLISESFPGQFRNWFYALLTESVALTGRAPFRNVYTYALMRDEKGAEMHKSKGNAIWFDDAAEEFGVDVMRWLFATVNPSVNMNFGPHVTDDVRRRFILPLWNSYSFFVTYANIDGWSPSANPTPVAERTLLDRWIISQLNALVAYVREKMDNFDPTSAARAIENFVVEELSNWYIRRNRRRFWKPESDADKANAYETLYEALVTVSKLIAPFMPFLSDEIYRNLAVAPGFSPGVDGGDAPPRSVHLTGFPEADDSLIDAQLNREMAAVLDVVKLGRAARSEANIKVRQPLAAILVHTPDPTDAEAVVRLKDQILDELNVKDVRAITELGGILSYEVKPNLPLLGPKYGKQLGALRQAIGALDPAAVADIVNAGQDVPVTLTDGTSVTLTSQELLVTMRKNEGYAAAQSEAATVVLDTELTPELIAEGYARDFVRQVQDLRKQLELNIDDRIVVGYSVDGEVAAAIADWRDWIAAEVLAVSLTAADDLVDATEIKVGSDTVLVSISRA